MIRQQEQKKKKTEREKIKYRKISIQNKKRKKENEHREYSIVEQYLFEIENIEFLNDLDYHINNMFFFVDYWNKMND